jgi:hypothetical protein
MVAVVKDARAAAADRAKDLGLTEPELRDRVLSNWFTRYLADDGNNGFLAQERHGLSWIRKSINKYGMPWDAPSATTKRDRFGNALQSGATSFAPEDA